MGADATELVNGRQTAEDHEVTDVHVARQVALLAKMQLSPMMQSWATWTLTMNRLPLPTLVRL